MTECHRRRLVDRHFAGTLGRRGEGALRTHLPGCPACRDRYDRQLVLESLDPRRPDPAIRLGRALGLQPRRPRRFAAPALATVLAGIAVLWLAPRGDRDSAIVARGAGDRSSHVFAYRIAAGDRASPAGGSVARSDELAFAYENPAGWPFLLVFGTDERRRVYWYHPPWRDPADHPTAIAIEAGAVRRELPAATRHELDGTSLRLHFVFTGIPLSVHTIEAIVDASPALADALAIPVPHAQASQLLEVRP